MILYTLIGHSFISDPEFGDFELEDGQVEVPEELGRRLHSTHIEGKPVWETSGERHERLVREEDARRRDPASLLAAVEALTAKVDAQVKQPPVKAVKK